MGTKQDDFDLHEHSLVNISCDIESYATSKINRQTGVVHMADLVNKILHAYTLTW